MQGTRKVPVEILVNGYPQIKTEIVADGSVQALEYELDIPRSSWVRTTAHFRSLRGHGLSLDDNLDNKLLSSSGVCCRQVAARVLPSSHTNPIFVIVGDKPIRAFRRSLQWCLESVDQCWSQKIRFLKEEEMEQAKLDYEHARKVYRERLAECEVDGPETTAGL